MKPFKTRFRKKTPSALTGKFAAAGRSVLMSSIPYILSLTAVGLFFGSVVAYALNSPAFGLSEVRLLNMGTVTPDQAFKFSELRRGENVVNIDLAAVQEIIKAKHSEFKEVRVKRVLPNRIDIVLKRRTPVAQVFFSRYIQLDRDRVILPGSSDIPFRNLMIIEGAPLPKRGLVVGASLNDPGSQKALKLAQAIRSLPSFSKHTLTKIDIADPRNISFFMDGSIEIKIGGNHFIERLKLLEQTVRSIDFDPAKIRYIDLRFDNVVIGPR